MIKISGFIARIFVVYNFGKAIYICFQNDMALKLRYGKNEEGNVRHFHSMLHKLANVNSYAFPPALTEDGIFINAVMKLDVKGNRFVPISHFEKTMVPRLAIIYLSWRDRTLPVSIFCIDRLFFNHLFFTRQFFHRILIFFQSYEATFS